MPVSTTLTYNLILQSDANRAVETAKEREQTMAEKMKNVGARITKTKENPLHYR